MIKNYGPIVDLGSFLRCIEQIRKDWPQRDRPERIGEEERLWLRGQRNADYGLSPKLYRPEFKDAQEAEIRQQFQSVALQLIQGRMPANKWDWYFMMQHYGAPTRLLDWTESPLVGLYFAVEERLKAKDTQTDAAVWVLDPWVLNKSLKLGVDGPMPPDWEEAQRYLLDLEDAFSQEEEVNVQHQAAIEPQHVDRRLVVQGSRFVIFGKTKDLTRLRKGSKKQIRLAKIVIRGTHIEGLRNELRLCGVTSASLFPDLGGLCKEICESWKRYGL